MQLEIPININYKSNCKISGHKEAKDNETTEGAGGADFAFALGTTAPGSYTKDTFATLQAVQQMHKKKSKSILSGSKKAFKFDDLEKADKEKTGMCPVEAFLKAFSKVDDGHIDQLKSAFTAKGGKKSEKKFVEIKK